MVAIKGRKTSSKNPPILSHEFVIQNHADIVSCVAMVFVVGLMVQVTSPWAYTFIALNHNVSSVINDDGSLPPQPIKYTTGWKDACVVFFYFLITIVMHAVIQEYIFDKLCKRYRLSKSKMSKFNESNQLLVFYAISFIWGCDIIYRDNLWSIMVDNVYPIPMSFSLKLYFIGQLAYWLHCYPELYFQRAKKEEMPRKIYLATLGLIFVLAAYIMNFQQIGVMLLTAHYASEALLHYSKLVHFSDRKDSVANLTYTCSKCVFLAARLIISFLAGFYFIAHLGGAKGEFNIAEGNFNIAPLRIAVSFIVAFFQIYMIYTFYKFEKKRFGEIEVPVTKPKVVKQKPKKKEVIKKAASSEDDDADSDQARRKSLRARASTAKGTK
ncbi:translocating chain-associated membrane protein 1-like 1 [Trichogramma pretiosum]|uniref:translocating chain-associated membrane protein 1-like 1 n=1 Tax=Trichogramma pretiosum TaxID=7493 RepID=UPI0006C992E5|nr:translocating chain-associated membrane protein 1-like 1 [Trichogramma pretiosum]